METIFDDPETREILSKIEAAFLGIASDRNVQAEFPSLQQSADEFQGISRKGYNDAAETAFLNLYCDIHRAGSGYTETERETLNNKHGYFNHPGGISPLLKAEPYLEQQHISADLGAGNGLQGLLFQYLYPHEKTIQIELSSELIRIGKLFQKALMIPENKIQWINDDILNIDLSDVDFLYLYRPSKPIKSGLTLYENLRIKLNKHSKPLTIFSIADCLKDYLNSDYKEFYNDGHLTCFNLVS
jgi:hypothetical protein